MSKRTNLEQNSVFKQFKEKRNCILFFLFASLSLLVMVVIFFFSHQTAIQSALLSDGLSETILDKLDYDDQQKAINFVLLKIYIRKFAHFFLFTVLGAFLTCAAVNINTEKQPAKYIIIALIGLFYGAFDELHQLFMEGRSSEVIDVFLDFFGVITGIVLAQLILKIIQIIAKKRKKA